MKADSSSDRKYAEIAKDDDLFKSILKKNLHNDLGVGMDSRFMRAVYKSFREHRAKQRGV